MTSDYLDFDISIAKEDRGHVVRVVDSPAGAAQAPFLLPFEAAELAQFMVAVGPPRVASRRLLPVAARLPDVKDYGTRLGDALLTGPVGDTFRSSLQAAGQRNLRLRLDLDAAPGLEAIPWEYLYDRELARFLTLSSETPVVRLVDAVDRPPTVTVQPPLRVLVLISSPSDLPALAVYREEQLLRATTADLVKHGQLELTVLKGTEATLTGLQLALLERYHVFHFIGHGGFDTDKQLGVLALERPDGTAHRVDGGRLGTLLHDAKHLQLAVLNACEGARTSGRDAFSGVGQSLVRQGLPAVVAMQTEISDRAALVFTHEFYAYLTRGLPIDAAICEVRKAMAISDEASEWGTAVLLRSGADQPFRFAHVHSDPGLQSHPQDRWTALYEGAQSAISAAEPDTARPMLEQLAAERPDFADVSQLLDRIRPHHAETEPTPPVPDGQPDPAKPVPDPHVSREHRHVPSMRLMGGAGLAVAAVAIGFALTRGPAQQLSGNGTSPGTGTAAALVGACGEAAPVPDIEGALVASCAVRAPTIDGTFEDWAGIPVTRADAVVFPKGGAPAPTPTAAWRSTWDRAGLYLWASVSDRTRGDVDPSQPAQFWRGDAVSFEFGPDARDLAPSAGLRAGLDRHVIVGLVGDRALGSMNVANRSTFPAGGAVPEITAAAQRTDTGYEVEAKVPWAVLGLDAAPVRGSVFAANLNVSDARSTQPWALGVMVSTNPARTVQVQPARWQPLVLADQP